MSTNERAIFRTAANEPEFNRGNNMAAFGKKVLLVCASLWLVLLTGCGGGGGGGGPTQPADTTVAPTISSQPTALSVRSGQGAAFSVTAAGTAPFSYQ